MSLNPDPEFEYSPLLDPAKKKYAWWVIEFLTGKDKIYLNKNQLNFINNLIVLKGKFMLSANDFLYEYCIMQVS